MNRLCLLLLFLPMFTGCYKNAESKGTELSEHNRHKAPADSMLKKGDCDAMLEERQRHIEERQKSYSTQNRMPDYNRP